jgi:hypothetical protein
MGGMGRRLKIATPKLKKSKNRENHVNARRLRISKDHNPGD